MMGVCSAIDARQKQRVRGAGDRQSQRSMPAVAQASLQKLQAAASKFADARAANETDLSGTARAALSIAARTAELDLLAQDLREYEARQAAASSVEGAGGGARQGAQRHLRQADEKAGAKPMRAP